MTIGSVISATSIFLTSTVLLLPSARTVAKLDVSLTVLVWMRRIVVPIGSRWRILTKRWNLAKPVVPSEVANFLLLGVAWRSLVKSSAAR